MSRLHLGLPILFMLAACTQKEPAMEEMDYELTEVETESDQRRNGYLAQEKAEAEVVASSDEASADRDQGLRASATPAPAPKAEPTERRYLEDSDEEEAAPEAEALDDFAWTDASTVSEVSVQRASGVTGGRTRGPVLAKGKKENKPASIAVTGTASTVVADLPPAPPPVVKPTVPDVVSDVTLPPVDANGDGTEAYVHYGVNDMTLVDKDRFSTFAVDVDTASYAITRRKLESGMLPPTSAVRVEEFVNAFHYDYTGPKSGNNDGAPFAVHMEAAPSPFDSTHQVLRVGVKGLEIDVDDREPMHLTFLVDTSGSMSSADKIGLAKQSLHTLTENLQPHDTVALVTYAGSTQVLLKPTKVSEQRTIHSAIDSLSTGGGTHMSTGMELAYNLASETAVRGHENRVVVLSDGDANIGRTNHEDILAVVGQFAEEGITLSTIGFGMGNYKDVLMEQLANQGDGNYAYIDSQAEADKVFGEDLGGTMLTIAKDVKLQVEFNPDAVIAYRLIGYENRDIADKDFRNDRVDAGEIGSGHDVTALYDVVLRKDASSKELATVRVRAKKPGADSAAREWATVFDGEMLHSEYAQASKDFQLAYSAATFAELLRGSPYVVEVSFYDVFALASRASRGLDEDKELLKLIDTAAKLSGERSPMVRR